MELKDLKVGMKVKIPKTKSVYEPISTSIIIKRALEANQDYLYFAGIDKEYGYIILDNEKNTSGGDFFLIEDIELYEDEKRTPENPMYSVKELEEREDLVIYLDSQEEFNKLKTITNNLTNIYYGKHCYSLYKRNYSSWSDKTNIGSYEKVKIIQINQIKELNMKEKEILGYKLIKPEYENAAKELTKGCRCDFTENFIPECDAVKDWEKAGVLALWFEPVFFEEETFKIGDWITITDTKGITGWMDDTDKRTFKIHGEKTKFHAGFLWQLKKGRGVYGEFRLATPEEIKNATETVLVLSNNEKVIIELNKITASNREIDIKDIKKLMNPLGTLGKTSWNINIESIKIGCWENVTRKDLQLIIDTYEEING